MKTKSLLFILAVFVASLFTLQANAKIWRVNNLSNYNAAISLWGDNFGGTVDYPVFAQLSDVMTSQLVSNDDTIHLEGSTVAYTSSTISKKLVIIGPGYFLTDNPNTSNNMLTAKIQTTYVFFEAGSAGSQLIGVYVAGGLDITVDNITVKRCVIEGRVSFYENRNDIILAQNVFLNKQFIKGNLFSDGGTATVTNLIFNNNICQWDIMATRETFSVCNNNVFDFPVNPNNDPSLQLTTGVFQNNILKTANAVIDINNSTNNNASFNISASAGEFGIANNNIIVANMNTLFVNSTVRTTDSVYQLKPNSPGSANGSDGTDRGAFGGVAITDRYTLSGLANIPVIYSITTPGVTSTDLPVTIKARTIK